MAIILSSATLLFKSRAPCTSRFSNKAVDGGTHLMGLRSTCSTLGCSTCTGAGLAVGAGAGITGDG